ncbi:catalase family peroxidase [Paraburkholderia solisilvae]|uniref:Catalase-related peroxidase n=1 Tax=Paraburkholderia solisilvae TaxID=624376 RepID=A0A6J5E8N7_9BURK|nr:catalase family peroxidase [Paraburkholderia solisilvae]CAB3761716.1 Catalase-related peroxidase [Paraburkholderia solisilvae]
MTSPGPSRNPLPAFVAIALVVIVLLLLFAWTGGWLTPNRVGGSTLVNILQYNAGTIHPGFRRAHSKGICVSGHFESNGAGAALSRAALFAPGSATVIGRFNTGSSMPDSNDAEQIFHGLGMRFQLSDGEEWRMALDQTPVFVVSNPKDFIALQIATKPDPSTHQPDPEKIKTFLSTHPETQRFFDYMGKTPMPSSFANGTYYSINAFRFTDATGTMRYVRWQFEPEQPFMALDKSKVAALGPNFLFNDLLQRVHNGPVKWHMILVPANPGDQTDNATVAWGPDHQRIDAGTLVFDQIATEEDGHCRDYNYDPLILPKGVARSEDPLLPARSAAYSVSFQRRAAEGPRPDAITLELQNKGEAK